jgi:hypothetical protein
MTLTTDPRLVEVDGVQAGEEAGEESGVAVAAVCGGSCMSNVYWATPREMSVRSAPDLA